MQPCLDRDFGEGMISMKIRTVRELESRTRVYSMILSACEATDVRRTLTGQQSGQSQKGAIPCSRFVSEERDARQAPSRRGCRQEMINMSRYVQSIQKADLSKAWSAGEGKVSRLNNHVL